MADIGCSSDGLHVLAARWQDFSRQSLRNSELIPSAWLLADDDVIPRLLIWRDHDLVVCRLAAVGDPRKRGFSSRLWRRHLTRGLEVWSQARTGDGRASNRA